MGGRWRVGKEEKKWIRLRLRFDLLFSLLFVMNWFRKEEGGCIGMLFDVWSCGGVEVGGFFTVSMSENECYKEENCGCKE